MIYTTQSFKDKLFESALEMYKEHWHKEGKRDATPIDLWLQYNKDILADQQWIHELGNTYEEDLYTAFGDGYDEEFCEFISIEINRYIEELEEYMYNQMNDYASDLQRI